jgi:hypothetical protein
VLWEKVQRLGGGRSRARRAGLKIESDTAERQLRDERQEHCLELAEALRILSRSRELERCGELGGAWPFLVGGLPCQVDSGNERDLSLLNSDICFCSWHTS